MTDLQRSSRKRLAVVAFLPEEADLAAIFEVAELAGISRPRYRDIETSAAAWSWTTTTPSGGSS